MTVSTDDTGYDAHFVHTFEASCLQNGVEIAVVNDEQSSWLYQLDEVDQSSTVHQQTVVVVVVVVEIVECIAETQDGVVLTCGRSVLDPTDVVRQAV